MAVAGDRLSELAELAEDLRHVNMARDNVTFWATHRDALSPIQLR
jgi:hypothetical protein